MKNFIKKYYQPLLVFTLAGLVGGFLVGLDLIDSYPTEIQEQILAQGGDRVTIAVAMACQYALYALILGAVGIVLSKKIGLWQDELTIKSKPLGFGVLVAFIGGVSMICFDLLWFGKQIQPVADSYLVKPSLTTVIGSAILGGIVEEVMLRLFMMSLLAWILMKILPKKWQASSDIVFIVANVISALLFAAGHLPATSVMLGITPLIVFRCFLLNGGIGLMFGWLYRKHGLQYAMIAHAGCHVVSKLIWILFI